MASPPQSTPGHGTTQSELPSNNAQSLPGAAVEMTDLDTSKRAGAGSQGGLLNDVSIPESSPMDPSFPAITTSPEEPKATAYTDAAKHTPESSKPPLSSASNENTDTNAAAESSSSAPAMSRLDSAAIGPAVEAIPPTVTSDSGPVLVITLLLTSGARHPYKIDEKYLTKRNVAVPGVTDGGRKDPYSISVYTLKELILREWREEWETQPTSPSSIRLIYFGRLLDDNTPLKECKFNAEAANVVHMTVRPQDIVDEEDASKSKALARDAEGGEGTAGCRCVIL